MLLMTALRMIDGVEQGPEPEDVKAGWIALVVFLLLCAAVVFLGFSLVKQLRKAQAAKDAGVYGDEPVTAPGATPPGDGSDPAADDEGHPRD
jgi:hypothetical protein